MRKIWYWLLDLEVGEVIYVTVMACLVIGAAAMVVHCGVDAVRAIGTGVAP